MKVLYVSKAMVVEAYRDKLEALGGLVDVTAVVPDRWGSERPEFSMPRGYALDVLPVRFAGQNHLHVYRKLDVLFDRFRPDLVHIDEEPYSAAAFQLASLSKRRNVPAIFFAWQNLPKRLPPPFNGMRSFVFHAVSGAIAGSENAAQVLTRAGYDGPVSIIPQVGVDASRFMPSAEARERMRARLGVRDEDLLVGYGGRLVREKGVYLLADVVAQVSNVRLVILGDGPERTRLERTTPSAHFAGRVPSVLMPAWLAALDVLVLPSLSKRGWREQFGRILVEAMSCGVPVIGSDSGEIPKVIGDAGVVVPEGDVAAMAAALGRLVASGALRRELGTRARARASACYSQERIARDTVQFYRSILAREARA